MADKIILVDTSILIDYFRKSEKSNSNWYKLVQQGYACCISAITEYEIFTGANDTQLDFWNTLLNKITILPFDHQVVLIAVHINNNLKRLNQKIEIEDLFIGATAVAFNLPFSTLNIKYFNRIEN